MTSETSTFEFDLRLHRLLALKKAAYKFSGSFDVQMQILEDKRVRVMLRQEDMKDTHSLKASDFPTEVLDQELRESISQETEGVRNLLLAQAFSSLSLVDPDSDKVEFGHDPLNIREDS